MSAMNHNNATVQYAPIARRSVPPDWHKRVSTIAAMFTLVLPVFYVFGLTYDQGYLVAFGIPPTLFARTIPEYLLLAYYAFVELCLRAWTLVWSRWELPVLLAVLGAVLGFLTKTRPTKKVRRAGVEMSPLQKRIAMAVGGSVAAGLMPYFLVSIAIVTLLVPLSGYYAGQHVAERNVAKQAPNCETALIDRKRWDQCISAVNEKGEEVHGYFLSNSSEYFALRVDGQTRIFPIENWSFNAHRISPGDAAVTKNSSR